MTGYRYTSIDAPAADAALPILHDYATETKSMASLMDWFSAEPEFLTSVDDSGTPRAAAMISRANSPGTLAQATMTKRPAILTNRINGRGSLLFNSARVDYLGLWSKNVPSGLTSPFSVVAVFAHNQATTTTGCLWGMFQSSSYSGKQYLAINSVGQLQFGVGNDVSCVAAAGAGIWRAAIASWDPVSQTGNLLVSGSSLVTDNVTSGTTAVATSNNQNRAALGGSADSTTSAVAPYNGEVADIQEHSVDLFAAAQAANLATIKANIYAQFGITI
jgi:hypothetical protein